ncbi:glycoside hydrolase family 127 protein [Dactylosporangium sp. AC04546]|uniref:glycoside hydrolase family 127 protein n=1 Tax=Dactylosporangium sp. AC04546 TaxID=2862460 RepID=UPI001EE0922E|nr:beta-L-arabinofuranosidase domain-containing protein [Dactylosporangium sp. AC04546]WVK80056.1 glycoside hydrolase family 127 protein [Dactylosporangium sp. AC04546]
MPVSRRTLLRSAAGTAAAVGATTLVELGTTAAATAARPDTGVSLYAFPLSAVSLLSSPFTANTARTQSYLLFLDNDRMLHTFRLNVGLSSSATACGGWESPTTELRGHSMGHLLSALAQAYASTGNTAFKTKGDALVTVLAQCQARAAAAGFNTGYLSAFPESFIDRVEARQSVWAPYYTLHKIMAGLLDMHLLAGNAQALTVLTGMASWVKFRNDRLTQTQRQNMLDTEFGGMNEVLTNLYQLTGTAAHLAAAQQFDHAEIFDPLASNTDALNNYHANTQIPKVVGAIREYHATGTTRYRDIAVNFWDIVVGHHTYAIGGNSNGEYFKAPDRIASELSDTTAECCNSYNMLKLTRLLFMTNPARADYMDYYEKALYNHILASQDPNSSHGFQCYYVPLRAGGIKTYSNDYNSFVCCHGTGMESNTKYGDTIYLHDNASTLYVNLFIPSVLTWSARAVTVRQETSFPEAGSTRLTVTGSGAFTMRIRIPAWANGAAITVNGAAQAAPAPGAYATLNRTWASGDVVEVTLPMALTRESTNDNSTVQAVKVGPIVLAGLYGTQNLSALPSLNPSSLTATSTPLQYTAGGVTLAPFYKVHGQRYSVYWSVTTTQPLPQFVAHYQFDSAYTDATGNGRTATGVNTSFVAGRTGDAVNLNGTNGYVALPTGILNGATNFSIALWVRIDTLTTWSRVFDFGSGSGVNMFLTPRSSTGTARFAITSSGSGGEQRIEAPAALPAGAWTHVAVTRSGNLGILYVNGAEVARNTGLTLSPSNLGATTQNWFGRSQYADPYLDGAIDSARLYSRALSAAEVASFASSGT